MKKTDSQEGWKTNLASDFSCVRAAGGLDTLAEQPPGDGAGSRIPTYVILHTEGCHRGDEIKTLYSDLKHAWSCGTQLS